MSLNEFILHVDITHLKLLKAFLFKLFSVSEVIAHKSPAGVKSTPIWSSSINRKAVLKHCSKPINSRRPARLGKYLNFCFETEVNFKDFRRLVT